MSIPESWWTWTLRANQLVRMTVAEAELQWAEWYPDSTFKTFPADAPDDYFVCSAITDAASFSPCATGPDDTDLTVTAQATPCSRGASGGTGAPTITPDTVVTSSRLYFSLNVETAISPVTSDASWASSGSTTVRKLKTAPDNTFAGTGTTDIFVGVNVALSNLHGASIWAYQVTDSALLAKVQAGGTSLTAQIRTRSRHGIGIDEASQYDIAQWVMRIYRPGTGFMGTMLTAHSSSTGTRFLPQATFVNRSWGGTAAAVGSAALNDWIVAELGARHITPTSGGAGAYWVLNSTIGNGDLPLDETTTTNLNSWIEICG